MRIKICNYTRRFIILLLKIYFLCDNIIVYVLGY